MASYRKRFEFADLAPNGMLEGAMVERIAQLQWRLARAGRMEAAIFALEHARRAFVLADERATETDPGKMPDWDWVRDNPPPETVWIQDDDAPHVIETVKEWNAECGTHKIAKFKRDRARETHRGMVEAATFSHFVHQPAVLETLSRYETGLYRQLEAALRQYWAVVCHRPRRPMPPVVEEAAPATQEEPPTL